MDLTTLSAFLEKLSGRTASVELLADAVDLSRPSYLEFCEVYLPPLLDSLSNERRGELAVAGPALRGQPVWHRTALARRIAQIPSTHFVTRLPKRSFALPENTLVRWLVGSLARIMDRMERRVGSAGLPRSFLSIRSACSEALKHHWFSQVEVPLLATSSMITAAQRQKNPAYRFAARLAAQRVAREARSSSSRWLAILDLLRANWLAPVIVDDLFELYTLVLVLDVLKRDLQFGDALEYGLVVSGRQHVARFATRDGGKILVFFDQSPVGVLSAQSRYQTISDAHTPSIGGSRRPDVIVSLRHRDGSMRNVFIEAKQSLDAGYIADSMYKAFGYIHDFADLWSDHNSDPKVILMVPENIALRNASNPSSVEVAVVASLDRANLARCLASSLTA